MGLLDAVMFAGCTACHRVGLRGASRVPIHPSEKHIRLQRQVLLSDRG